MTATKTATLRHTLRVDIISATVEVEAPETVDIDNLSEVIGMSFDFDSEGILYSLAKNGYNIQNISIDNSNLLDGADVEVYLEETEVIEED